MTDLQIEEFLDVFTGSKSAFGRFIYGNTKKGDKIEGKASTVTDTLVTFEDYKKHISGEAGLGIVPINEENKVRFAVIDVDIYDHDLTYFVRAIEKYNFPLLPFRSKSGGLHIYLFLKEPEPAKKIIDVMKKFAFVLTIDQLVKRIENRSVEIFPKQAAVEKGKSGNWINLPYFNAGDNCKNPAIYKNKLLSVQDALFRIKQKATTLQGAIDFLESLPFSDAPPCLQRILITGDTTAHSGRNNFLFSAGVYLKKKDEQYFEDEVKTVNSSMADPLDDREVEATILSSLRQKDYVYKCKESPLCDYCDKAVCRKRAFGVGASDGYFSTVEFGKLTQYRSLSPYYEWNIKLQGQNDYKRLRFNDEMDILRQDKFLILVMRELYELPVKIKQAEWFKIVNAALGQIEVIQIEEDDDTSPAMMLKRKIFEFLAERTPARNKSQILLKRTFIAEDYYYFRPRDMSSFIWEVNRFPHFSSGHLHGFLRELGGSPTKVNLESGKQVRVWRVPRLSFNDTITPDPEDKHMIPDFSEFVEEEKF